MWKRSRLIACAGVAGLAAVTLTVPAAQAADIYDKYGARSSSPYEDPRYADIYTHPAPRYSEPRYVEPAPPYAEPRYERPYAYDDEAPRAERDRYGYLRPMQPKQRRYAEQSCLPHGEIRRALADEGWRDFRDLEYGDKSAVVQARRPNGQVYALRIDRCTGDIVNARPLEEQRPVPYAYRDRYGGRTY